MADRDRSVDLDGKQVGLIGNRSSAIQVLPVIQPKVAKLITFVRCPTWVYLTHRFEPHVYTEEERECFWMDLAAHLVYWKNQEDVMNDLFLMFFTGSAQQQTLFTHLVQAMNDKLGGWND
ncbi:hypothetical protein C0995_013172 [Termitomyces sp. Mi166|nr:hypothetical protein C0995_013172 [Termitomyces sp. Mi166\